MGSMSSINTKINSVYFTTNLLQPLHQGFFHKGEIRVERDTDWKNQLLEGVSQKLKACAQAMPTSRGW
jgi:hypothetical protein